MSSEKAWKKWLLGLLMILAALAAAAVAFLDNDPATKVDAGKTIEQVKEGIEVIKNEPEAPAEVPVEEDPTE